MPCHTQEDEQESIFARVHVCKNMRRSISLHIESCVITRGILHTRMSHGMSRKSMSRRAFLQEYMCARVCEPAHFGTFLHIESCLIKRKKKNTCVTHWRTLHICVTHWRTLHICVTHWRTLHICRTHDMWHARVWAGEHFCKSTCVQEYAKEYTFAYWVMSHNKRHFTHLNESWHVTHKRMSTRASLQEYMCARVYEGEYIYMFAYWVISHNKRHFTHMNESWHVAQEDEQESIFARVHVCKNMYANKNILECWVMTHNKRHFAHCNESWHVAQEYDQDCIFTRSQIWNSLSRITNSKISRNPPLPPSTPLHLPPSQKKGKTCQRYCGRSA